MPEKNSRKRKIVAKTQNLPRKKIKRGENKPNSLNSDDSSTVGIKLSSNQLLPTASGQMPSSSKRAISILVRPELLRRIVIFASSGTLLFSAGVQIGSQSGASTVDQAIDSIIDSGAKDLDRKILERAAIEGALKASGDLWANYFPKSALEVLDEQSSNVFTGVGVGLNKTRRGQIQIASIQEN